MLSVYVNSFDNVSYSFHLYVQYNEVDDTRLSSDPHPIFSYLSCFFFLKILLGITLFPCFILYLCLTGKCISWHLKLLKKCLSLVLLSIWVNSNGFHGHTFGLQNLPFVVFIATIDLTLGKLFFWVHLKACNMSSRIKTNFTLIEPSSVQRGHLFSPKVCWEISLYD